MIELDGESFVEMFVSTRGKTFRARRVENGYFLSVDGEGKTYIAASVTELNNIIRDVCGPRELKTT